MLVGHWLAHLFGLDNGSGGLYLFWSGIGGDVSQVAVLLGLVGMWRKHNCHVHRCWRLARHPVAGTGWVVCRRHHPTDPPSAADVLSAHERARASG